MAKMEIDVPYFKRCCFCIPLRYGLFAWGSLKLYLTSLMLTKTVDFDSFTYSPIPWLYILSIVFTILLVAAAIMKNQTLYQIYYKCAIAELLLLFIIFVLLQMGSVQGWFSSVTVADDDDIVMAFTLDSVMILGFFAHGYITLLIRSKLIKLREAAANQVTDNTVEIQSQSQSPIGKSVDV